MLSSAHILAQVWSHLLSSYGLLNFLSCFFPINVNFLGPRSLKYQAKNLTFSESDSEI